MPLANPPNLRQTATASISVNTTTTSGSFVDLLTLTLTIAGNSKLILKFNACVSCTSVSASAKMQFRFLLDAASISVGTQAHGINANESAPINMLHETAGLVAGDHTIKVQWLIGNGTLQCRPIAVPDAEYGRLLVMEVAV